MMPDTRDFGILSLKENTDESLREVLKTIFNFENGRSSRKHFVRLFFISSEECPRNGSTKRNSFFGTEEHGFEYAPINKP